MPFHEFVVKIHSRCDLACDYCYMYEMADQSCRHQPTCMSAGTAAATAFRIGEHVRTNNVPAISLILHGGEPLLAGRDLITQLVQATHDAVDPDVLVDVRVQSNGVGLDEPYLDLFDQLNVRIGVSLDGSPKAHDRHRRFVSGRGSHMAVAAGLGRLTDNRYRHLFSGLLCTVDLRNDPLTTYEALTSFGPPEIDFLLPHGTWADPPPGRVPGVPDTPYADWLITVFDLVLPTALSSSPTPLKLLRGGACHWSAGRPRLIRQALYLPGMVARQLGERALATKCQQCHVLHECGGGLYAHRYRPGGFKNHGESCNNTPGGSKSKSTRLPAAAIVASSYSWCLVA
jgi:uncharacterized protein